ncbi:hypothetical protein CP97_06960 [Aurantiacibacter atlanticus]|uniref:Lipoprotein n=1 Tax=Aurantiacibacter atlanticus TaxID=1648404 RepID=A0A0H4VXI5_9SPHN|nr:hypothetical protein [Aurantiacibacter atlanticus]AKQ41818.1 hypothetical protein CP97_06960 [Aurantiacibacter atlanticus]MDF1833706.1 hypothetical protein [Alteraurantiacibacter sp. bin_em_oilr2.035]
MQLNRFRLFTTSSAIIGAMSLAACVPPSPQPTPAPTPAPPPVSTAQPVPPQVITPSFDDWLDAPQTTGDWRYSAPSGVPMAQFGPMGSTALFSMRCDQASRSVAISRSSSAQSALTMRIRTETADKDLTAGPQAGSVVTAQLSAEDAFLDAMALSKGRFAIELPGESTLYLPAWPEVSRVIEECRR